MAKEVELSRVAAGAWMSLMLMLPMAGGGEARAQAESGASAAGTPSGSIAANAAGTPSSPISIDEALARAAQRPLVGMAEAGLEEAKGVAQQAALPAHNPELSAAAGPRWVEGARDVALQVAVAQTLELGGKRAARREVAEARLAGMEVERRSAALMARAEAWLAFQRALAARERRATALEAEQVALQVEEATRERQKAGFGTQLELNLTTAEVGRARHERLDAERRYEEAAGRLASAVGAGAGERLEPTGTLALPPALEGGGGAGHADAGKAAGDAAGKAGAGNGDDGRAAGNVAGNADALVASALRGRAAAQRAQAGRRLAAAAVRAADAAAVPDLTLGVSYAQERDPGAVAQTVLATASIGLPLWNRNQGERRATRAAARRAELEAAWTATEIEREVRLALLGYQRAREAVMGFDREVNERLHENLELARESYTSGKIDSFQFNVVRRELLASRNAYLDAFEEMVDAWSALQQATGAEVMP